MLAIQVSGFVSDECGESLIGTHVIGVGDYDNVSQISRTIRATMASDETRAPIYAKDRFGDLRQVGWRVSSRCDGVHIETNYIVKAVTSTGKFRKVWFN